MAQVQSRGSDSMTRYCDVVVSLRAMPAPPRVPYCSGDVLFLLRHHQFVTGSDQICACAQKYNAQQACSAAGKPLLCPTPV